MTQQKIPIWRDDRFWKIALQILTLVIIFAVFAAMGNNLSRNLKQTGNLIGFSFLRSSAGFSILDSLIPYKPIDPYSRVLLAGLINSLRVMFFGIILTTFLGIIAGVSQFSDNWLVRKIALVYIEIVRNTPLLLQLLFWYGIFVQLPPVQEQLNVLGLILLSKQGIYIPWPSGKLLGLSLILLGISAITAFLIGKWRTRLQVEQGKSGQPQLMALWGLATLALIILTFGLGWQRPVFVDNSSVVGGLRLTIEFTSILVGLVVYTGAYIAEIVRGGIQSVPKGQWEAARSLGLNSGLLMQLIIFPQALRVIIPSLNSQYLNLAKNSSLAIAVAYADLYNVANTTFNQTGRAVEVMLIIMATYLTIDLLISLGMNLLNKTVQLKER